MRGRREKRARRGGRAISGMVWWGRKGGPRSPVGVFWGLYVPSDDYISL
jgi:hypothetical protein